jgi:hypothetical protein
LEKEHPVNSLMTTEQKDAMELLKKVNTISKPNAWLTGYETVHSE